MAAVAQLGPVVAQTSIATIPDFVETRGMPSRGGLLAVFYDGAGGRVLLGLPRAGADGVYGRYIYTEYLAAGLGSNPVGLDRAQPGKTYIVVLRRRGKRVFIEAENYGYVATSNIAAEQAAVRQSFASSVLWATDIMEETESGRALIDLSPFLLRDVHGVATTLAATGQGSFSLNQDLSAVDVGATLVFPLNVEMEALLTFTSDEPGPEVVATTPEPRNMTLRLHHSFVALPAAGYQKRELDRRSGAIGMRVMDYGVRLAEPVERLYAIRHRLEKTNPAAQRSRVRKPIVYYVDRGTPQAVRQALIEGASWWAEAFDAAGFIDAFRVRELPSGAHPLDVRYNMINWVHRQTRGWSYGASVVDPRTGEIVKGNVLLGSLRVRQDRMIFEGLVGADASGAGGPNDPVQIALARIRQLSAHEVGHTLGFQHNMAASTNDRASVMDYPAPRVRIVPGSGFDLSEAYAVGIGLWDKSMVRWLYSQFAPGTDEKAALDAIVLDAFRSGLRYVSDSDSRPDGTAHPYGNLWDTGNDPVASLRQTMRVRQVALSNFGPGNIASGRPTSDLRDVIVPIYLFHRYQVEAAAKSVGGMAFNYSVRGDGLPSARPVEPAVQRAALDAVLATLAPAALDLSDRVLNLLEPPQRDDGPSARAPEEFKGASGPTFDLLGAADAAASITLGHLLHPARLARLAEFNRRSGAYPGVGFVLSRTRAALFDTGSGDSDRQGTIRGRVQTRYVSILIGLGASPEVTPEVRAEVDAQLRDISQRLSRSRVQTSIGAAHAVWLRETIERYLSRPAEAAAPAPPMPASPPGSPIGEPAQAWGNLGIMETCWHCAMP